MFDALMQPFVKFSFMRRTPVGCLALSLGAPPMGVFLVLRRMSLMGDAMSQAILPDAAVGYLIAGLSRFAMPAGGLIIRIAVALLALLVSRSTVLREDVSFAAFYSVSLASGVLIECVRESNVDLLHVLFGTIIAIEDSAAALILRGAIVAVSMVALAVIYRPLLLESLGPNFLRSGGRVSSSTHSASSFSSSLIWWAVFMPWQP
jgi:zinc/manganese transport system permease protein